MTEISDYCSACGKTRAFLVASGQTGLCIPQDGYCSLCLEQLASAMVKPDLEIPGLGILSFRTASD